MLLIEAGPDTPPGHEPPTILDIYPRSYSDPRFLWPNTRIEVRDGNPTTRLIEQGRVLGGSSSIMGMVALRGLPQDYDEWSKFGLQGWGWTDVLPYFNRLEADEDFGGPEHDDTGPISVRRHPTADWPPFCRAVAESLSSMPLIGDMNTDFRDGIGALPRSCTEKNRVSAAIGYCASTSDRRPKRCRSSARRFESV